MHNPLCFDLSQMSTQERERIEGLQRLLELPTFNDAFAYEGAILRAIRDKAQPPYDGWFPGVTGEKRDRLLDYVAQRKQIYSEQTK